MQITTSWMRQGDALILQANFRISRQLYEEVLRTANELD